MGKSDFAPDGEGGTRQPTVAARPAAPSGWYDYDGESRWWTGSQWGQFASEIPSPPPGTKPWKGEPDPVGGGWYVCAVLLPGVAFIAGIVFMAQRRPGGGGVFAVSIAAWLVWVIIFTAAGA